MSYEPPGPSPDPRIGGGLIRRLRTIIPHRGQPESVHRFRDIEMLGGGCMGKVFRAYDCKLERRVALKVSMGTESSRVSFANEVRALSIIDHPNIVRLLDNGVFCGDGEVCGRQFLVMDLVDGKSLRDRLAVGGRMEWGEARHALLQLCDALYAVHEAGIVHRDVKPDNIAFSGTDAVLLDFGVSERIRMRFSLAGIMGARFGPGNLDYTAPEVVNGRCDARTDVFSLGKVMHHMISGRAPLNAAWLFGAVAGVPQDPIVRDAEVAPDQAEIIARATEASMGRRYQTALEMKAAIGSV